MESGDDVKELKLLLLLCLGVFLLSCSTNKSPEVPANLVQIQEEYQSLAKNMNASVAYIAEPLKGLTAEQKGSVAALIVMSRLAAQCEATPGKANLGLSEEFWFEVLKYCPIPKKFDFSRGGCLDADLAYASGMARCLKEGKTEDQCELENSVESAAAVLCHMKEIEQLRNTLLQIPGRQLPPRPFPWPIGALDSISR